MPNHPPFSTAGIPAPSIRGGAGVLRFNARAIADERGVLASPASILIQSEGADVRGGQPWGGRILAVGTPRVVDGHPAAGAGVSREGAGPVVLDLPRHLLIPGMVNAHTHLDLTHIGPQAHDPQVGFMPWIEMVRANRATEPGAIAASVARGIELSRSAGVVAIGDIAGAPRGRASLVPAQVMARSGSGIAGVSFLEFFGIGRGLWTFKDWLPELLEAGAADATLRAAEVRVGLQPHAPNTVDALAYGWAAKAAAELDLPTATHLAETPEEREFVSRGTGPQRMLLERLGLWDDDVLERIGHGQHPIDHIIAALQGTAPTHPAPLLAAHVNDANPEQLQRLAAAGIAVAYCPMASAYFGASERLGPHRYLEMIRAGVLVALGTDSLINLPASASRSVVEGGRGISIWDQVCLLRRRDQADARTLLAMATTMGATALGLDAAVFRFNAGTPLAGLVAVETPDGGGDPLNLAMDASGRAMLLFDKNDCRLARTNDHPSASSA